MLSTLLPRSGLREKVPVAPARAVEICGAVQTQVYVSFHSLTAQETAMYSMERDLCVSWAIACNSRSTFSHHFFLELVQLMDDGECMPWYIHAMVRITYELLSQIHCTL